jgi:hypothetical protein
MKSSDKILIQQLVDGELDPQQKDAAFKTISNDPDAARYFQQLKALNDLLATDSSRQHKVDLTAEIHDRILHHSVVAAGQNGKTIWELLFPNTWSKMTVAFAAGILIGLFLISPLVKELRQSSIDQTNSGGTIRNIGPNAISLDKVSLPGISILIGKQPVGRYAQLLRLVVDASIPVEISILPQQADVTFQNISLKDHSGNCELYRDSRGIRMNIAGRQEVIITVETPESKTVTLQMRIADHDKLIYEKMIEL